MDILYLVVFVAVALLVVVLRLNAPRIRGGRGESRVANVLSRLDNSQYKVLNDLLIRTTRGTSQIDHVVVSPQGIFVIETKNYSGWIHGGEKSEYWTQSIFRKKYEFRNPIKQNWAHVYGLKEILSDFGQISYHPVVVFTRSSELKNVHSKLPVSYVDNLLQIITETKGGGILSGDQVLAIQRTLDGANILDQNLRGQHVRGVQNRVHLQNQSEQLLICPKCGATLVVRAGKYGKFYGCSNYPRCRHILKF